MCTHKYLHVRDTGFKVIGTGICLTMKHLPFMKVLCWQVAVEVHPFLDAAHDSLNSQGVHASPTLAPVGHSSLFGCISSATIDLSSS